MDTWTHVRGGQLTGTSKGFYLHDLRYTVGNISSTVVKIEMDARMVRFLSSKINIISCYLMILIK